VKNLSFKTTEEHLREIFGDCGEIATVRLPTFPDTGKPTGYVANNIMIHLLVSIKFN
jgi:RNA recognition motif-containing protein